MMFNLPTNKNEVDKFSCAEMINSYMILSATQKRKWLRSAAGSNGSIRLSQPADASSIQINTWDDATGAYAGCSWVDKDPFDAPSASS